MRLHKMIKLQFDLELLTGLHIGSGDSQMKIGGADAKVVVNPLTSMPYIPGSSLKGKLRFLLGQKYGVNDLQDDTFCLLFGRGAGEETDGSAGPTRLLFRDLQMTPALQADFQERQKWGEAFMEEKAENTITRNEKMEAKPRFIERVPAGVVFTGEIVLRLFDDDEEEKFKNFVLEGLELLADDGLGGSISRGYGQVKITQQKWV